MLRTRVIPCLLSKEGSLVKTIRFKKFNYIGDPVNTVRIFNELEVDELMFLDILASKKNRNIDFELIKDIADECFMPLSYGGGIKNIDEVQKIFEIGVEKVVLNSQAFGNLNLVESIAKKFGNQSIIGSIDIKKNFWGRPCVYSHHGTAKQKVGPLEWAKKLENSGVGELLITSIDQEGTWSGFDLDLIKLISENVRVPVIASGGAGCFEDIKLAVKTAGASAVALGSLVVYQKKGMGVLVNFPEEKKLKKLFE